VRGADQDIAEEVATAPEPVQLAVGVDLAVVAVSPGYIQLPVGPDRGARFPDSPCRADVDPVGELGIDAIAEPGNGDDTVAVARVTGVGDQAIYGERLGS
jgi:hypothetical protein